MGRVLRKRATVVECESNDFNWEPAAINNDEELTLLSAICQIISVVRNSRYDSRIFEVAERPIAYICDILGFSKSQAVVYAIVMEIYYDRQISTCDIGRCLDMPPLKAMMFHKELEELCQMKYIVRHYDEEELDSIYSVTSEAIASLQNNRAIERDEIVIESVEDWFVAFDGLVVSRCNERINYEEFCTRANALIEENDHLPFVKKYQAKTEEMDEDDKMLLLWVCNMVVSDGFDTVESGHFKKLYSNMLIYRNQRKSLANGSNALIRGGLLQVATMTETRSRDTYELSRWVVDEMLVGLNVDLGTTRQKDILAHSSITPKELFYNDRERVAIDRLASLLQPARFHEVRETLQRKGFRSGFACLFHGAPGTGKTETALQLARLTGRDIMQVNISEIKGMWVGESEKNIKAVFSRYRKLVEESEVAPILLFNEADALIGKRLESVTRSVDKMENAMQNIILEEMEQLDGILIATTNLTCNMDTAFERRFLYKIEFEKPTVAVKSAIWQMMIEELTDDDARQLASKYDFSGGQIENIARKSIVDKILLGTDLSLDTLYGHCDSELLGRDSSTRKIGY